MKYFCVAKKIIKVMISTFFNVSLTIECLLIYTYVKHFWRLHYGGYIRIDFEIQISYTCFQLSCTIMIIIMIMILLW